MGEKSVGVAPRSEKSSQCDPVALRRKATGVGAAASADVNFSRQISLSLLKLT
ncbi:MAG: hypothetical protein V7L25_26955 [Nostoc sp.]|uniref:hypothetical protein n=1 Tax=Nostoc sp. TaxID=1180 RepID=UPI002FEFBAA3